MPIKVVSKMDLHVNVCLMSRRYLRSRVTSRSLLFPDPAVPIRKPRRVSLGIGRLETLLNAIADFEPGSCRPDDL